MSEDMGASIDISSFDRIERKGFASKLAKMAIANPLPASLESSTYVEKLDEKKKCTSRHCGVLPNAQLCQGS